MTKLQYLRKKNYMTQFELAKETGISMQSLQKYEQGIYPIEGVRVNNLLALCKALNCKIWDLMDDETIAAELRRQICAPLVQQAER